MSEPGTASSLDSGRSHGPGRAEPSCPASGPRVQDEPEEDPHETDPLGRGQEALSPDGRTGADGARARDEPEEAREAGQSQARALEAAASPVHRGELPEAIQEASSREGGCP